MCALTQLGDVLKRVYPRWSSSTMADLPFDAGHSRENNNNKKKKEFSGKDNVGKKRITKGRVEGATGKMMEKIA